MARLTGDAHPAELPLFTSIREIEEHRPGGNHGVVRCGGITIYAASEAHLFALVQQVLSSIGKVLREHASLSRSHLEILVERDLGASMGSRVAEALFGTALRTGIMDQIPCAAISGKTFRVYVHASARETFSSHVETVKQRLRQARELHVGEVRKSVIRSKEWGAWSSASYILARLVQLGAAKYIDAKNFAWPEELDRASCAD